MGEGPITHHCKNSVITETGNTFQGLYGHDDGTDQVPQDNDMMYKNYLGRMTLEGESCLVAHDQKSHF